MKKPPHKTVAQLGAIIAKLEAWQNKNTEYVEDWRINGIKSDLIAVMRRLEDAREQTKTAKAE